MRTLHELLAEVAEHNPGVADELLQHVQYLELQHEFDLATHVTQRDAVRESLKFPRTREYAPHKSAEAFVGQRIAWTLDGYPTIANGHVIADNFHVLNVAGQQTDSEDLAYYLDNDTLNWFWDRGSCRGHRPFELVMS